MHGKPRKIKETGKYLWTVSLGTILIIDRKDQLCRNKCDQQLLFSLHLEIYFSSSDIILKRKRKRYHTNSKGQFCSIELVEFLLIMFILEGKSISKARVLLSVTRIACTKPWLNCIKFKYHYRVTHKKVRNFLNILRPKECPKVLGVLKFRKYIIS